MAKEVSDDRRAKLIAELQSEKFFGEIQDALLRLWGVDGRSILHLILASIIAANPAKGPNKPTTRLAKIEQLPFGNEYEPGYVFDNEVVLIWMYRQLLAERLLISPTSLRTKTVEGGIDDIALAAVKKFHPELFVEASTEADAEKANSLERRYRDDFYKHHDDLRWRYSRTLNEGEENKIVAAALLKVLEAAGLKVEHKKVQLSMLGVSESELEESEREIDLAVGTKSPKKQ